ncbi:MAG: nickel-dependent lactate racemase [Oscillibacter sp.]
MRVELGFGAGTQSVEIPEEHLLGILEPNPVPRGLTGGAEIARAMARPIGSKRLRDLVKSGEKIAIVTSDITRPMPTALALPYVLDELYAGGVQGRDITLVFALGSHRRHTPQEQRRLAGERAWAEINIVDGDAADCVSLGVTRRGTPVDIVRVVAEADVRIALGNIEYHYFAGYSGGDKAIMPGVSTRAAIQANHRLMVLPQAAAGRLAGNPLREDIEEAAALCPLTFLLNVVLDEHKQVLRAVAGDHLAAHRAGCAFLDTLYRKELPARADIVLVSQGGAPKDLNLYQVQKALDNAKHAVKPGGVVILVGACNEGLGEATFERWMTTLPSPAAMVERIGQDFQLGGHKAAAIAMVLENADIYLVSQMDPDFVRRIFLTPFATVQEALDAAAQKCGPEAGILVMPYGGSTLPVITGTATKDSI